MRPRRAKIEARVPVASCPLPCRTAWALSAALLLVASGCAEQLNTTYGQRQSGWDNQSVNGTSVLAAMFQQRGHQVTTWRWLSPRLQRRADAIVWFDTDMEPPDEETCRWLEDWLLDRPGRTLIYVGRDFDAAPRYWETVIDRYPKRLRSEANAQRIQAEQFASIVRAQIAAGDACDWFAWKPRPPRKPRALVASDPAWLSDCAPSRFEIELVTEMVPAEDFEPLLATIADEALVSRSHWGESQIVLVSNGSFLLNLPLVNQQHRRLADRLVRMVGPPGRRVVFLEPFGGDPPILEKDPDFKPPSPLRVLEAEPLGSVLLHLMALGIIFAFSRWPSLVRRRPPPATSSADFGQHVVALGRLLARTGDTEYARRQLELYRRSIRGEGRAVGGRLRRGKRAPGASPQSPTQGT